MNNHDPYYDENHHALKNKLNIIDRSKLDKVEAALAMVAIIEIRKNPFEITSVFDILKIHKMLFGELYEWAGTIRTITMYKREPILGGASVDYTPSQYIEPELEELDKEFRNIDWKYQGQCHRSWQILA